MAAELPSPVAESSAVACVPRVLSSAASLSANAGTDALAHRASANAEAITRLNIVSFTMNPPF